jgi:DNA-directed RNA polymerase specialized sigma24 family protein
LTPSLVVQLRDGHADAGKVLDQLYRSRLVRFALGYLGNREEAEDTVQDVFYRVINSPAVPNNFRAWIYEICRNCCLDRLRAKNRRLDDQTLPTTSYFADHMTGNLTRLIKGVSRAEISQVLGIPENLVKHRIYNGLEKLRKHKSLDQKH